MRIDINRQDAKHAKLKNHGTTLNSESHCASARLLQNTLMNLDALYSELTLKTNAKLALVVLDGLGDIATKEQNYLTPLEAATTPNLDKIAKDSAQGRMIPIAPGITPGSGPGHLGLFGYDPLEFQVGRGVIEALGLGLELKPGDVCARANFATVDGKGIVTDRRAGRIPTETCEKLCAPCFPQK
jgi:2,3-bisphosphoglycerate-independent phosphoglycerate mutase